MSEGNMFGGKNRNGLYVPLSEDEQEVLERLVQMNDVQLIIHGWGTIDRPVITVGDHRISVRIRLTFKAPAEPQPVYFFDMELRTHQTGITLFRKRMPCTYDNKPIYAQAGTFVDLVWDIALHSMNPKVVKLLKPGATGLTSRRQDADTGEITDIGNMRLDGVQKRTLQALEEGAARVRDTDTAHVVRATKQAGYEVKLVGGKIEAPDV
jgi:hypothetical protein